MRKIFVTLCIISLIFLVTTFFRLPHSGEWKSLQGTMQTTIKEVLPGVVMISVDGESTGAGIFIDENHVLTSYHILWNEKNITMLTTQGETISGKLESTIPVKDLALLILEKRKTGVSFPQILESTNALKMGDFVIAFGISNQEILHTFGIISRIDNLVNIAGKDFWPLIQTDINMRRGFSGGPLFDINWNLLGINTAVAGADAGIGWSTPVTREVIQALRDAE